MAENINKTRLLVILQTLAQGHYEQAQLIKALQNAGIDEAAVNRLIEERFNTLLDGAPATFDTLKEIADKLAADESALSAVLSKLTALQEADNAIKVRLDAVEIFGDRLTTLESQRAEAFEIPDTWLADIQRRMSTGA